MNAHTAIAEEKVEKLWLYKGHINLKEGCVL